MSRPRFRIALVLSLGLLLALLVATATPAMADQGGEKPANSRATNYGNCISWAATTGGGPLVRMHTEEDAPWGALNAVEHSHGFKQAPGHADDDYLGCGPVEPESE